MTCRSQALSTLLARVEDAYRTARREARSSPAASKVVTAWWGATLCVQAALDGDPDVVLRGYVRCTGAIADCTGHVSYDTLVELVPVLAGLHALVERREKDDHGGVCGEGRCIDRVEERNDREIRGDRRVGHVL